MKFILKPLLKYYLKIITKLVLAIHRPRIIAVAGSTNKYAVRDEIKKELLSRGYTVRANPKNFNTEIGLPLAILNIESGYNSYQKWLPVIVSAARAIFQKDFPDFLVLELGVSNRGDMKYLLTLVRPEVSVITDITQRYIESFSGLDRMLAEYEYLVKKTKKKGLVILNYDNLKVRNIAKKANASVWYFGQTSPLENGVRIASIEKTKKGQTALMEYRDRNIKLEIPRFGAHHVNAAAVGVIVRQINI